MIKEEKVETYRCTLICDKCGTEMESDGTVLCSYPAQYPHFCPKCGEKRITLTQYPTIEYRSIE